MIDGACLCGALRYAIDGRVQYLSHCHCSMCRKHHGAPFASFVDAPAQAFRWLSGEGAVRTYASSPSLDRRFCGVCGAVAPTVSGGRAAIPAGNLAGELGEVGGAHAFVGSKAPWHVIADDLPQHEGPLPEWPPAVSSRPAEPHADGRIHGTCLCGDVAFSVEGRPARWLQCHCSRCRRSRSAAHGSNTFYPAAQFSWSTGRERVQSFRPHDAQRFTVAFCGRCGGGAPVEREGVPFVLVPAGIFDDDPGARPEAHIHVASKAPWYAIRDDLPQFAELPPS